MKYKKVFTLTIAILLSSILTIHTDRVSAQTADELQRMIEERNRNIEQLNKEIKLYEDLADKTSQEAKTLQSAIKVLEQNANALGLDIKKTSSKIDVTNLDIKKISLSIHGSEEKIDRYKEGLSASIREISRKEDTGLVESFLGSESLSSMLAEIEDQLSFNQSIKRQVDELNAEKNQLEESKKSQENRKKDLVNLQQELSGKKQVIDSNKKEQNQLLKETKNQEKSYQILLADRQQKKAALEKEIFEYESKLKYTLDPSSIPKAGSSAFAWPVDNVRITQFFGKTVAAKRLYTSGSHNGVDFGVPLGTPVKALASGVVAGYGDTDLTCKGASFGKWILIKYNNGLAATFGHLSLISVRNGQTVQVGDIVGYSGNSGYSTGPHLHVSAYPANGVNVESRPSATCGGRVYTMPIAPVDAYLDPMLYFPPKP